jgi:hypothetical protein
MKNILPIVIFIATLFAGCAQKSGLPPRAFADYGRIVFNTVEYNDNALANLTSSIQEFYRNVGREIFYKVLLDDKNSTVYLLNGSNVRLDFPPEMVVAENQNAADYLVAITLTKVPDPRGFPKRSCTPSISITTGYSFRLGKCGSDPETPVMIFRHTRLS